MLKGQRKLVGKGKLFNFWSSKYFHRHKITMRFRIINGIFYGKKTFLSVEKMKISC